MDSPWAALVLTGAAVVISVVLLATAAWVFVQAFSWTRSQISKVLPALTPLEVAGGLLATLLLVPEPFVVLLRLVLLLVRTLAYDIPISLINGLAPSCVDTSSLSQMCAGFVTQTANSVWQDSVTRALVLLGENPFSKLGKRGGSTLTQGTSTPIGTRSGFVSGSFAEKAVEAVFAFLIAVVVFRVIAMLYMRLRAAAWKPAQMMPSLKICALAGSLLLALYLCIAAIVAIPVFNDMTDQVDEGSKQLHAQLPDLAKLYADSLHTEIPAEDAINVQKLRNTLRKWVHLTPP